MSDRERFRRPEIILAELLTKASRGEILSETTNHSPWKRAVVVAIDVLGGRLENPNGEGSMSHTIDGKTFDVNAKIGPPNPRNSIKARVLTSEADKFYSDDGLKVFWPMLPEHDSVPIKPGEHVYVTFEDREMEHGLWLGKVSGQENLNYYRGQDSYAAAKEERPDDKFGDAPKDDQDKFVPTDQTFSGRLASSRLLNIFKDEE